MSEVIEIGNATLIHGDSMVCLNELLRFGGTFMSGERAPVDLIVTDPPYKLTSGGDTGEWKLAGDSYDNSGEIVPCNIDWPDFMPLFHDVLAACSKEGRAHCYVMCNNRHIANCENAALAAGFGLHNWLVWDKITATPNRWYMKNLEFTGLFYVGKAFHINDCGAKQLIRMEQRDESKHPTEKPVALMEHYITNSSQAGDTVLDPFMGSGSTGVAALRAGRKFVGIEQERKYFDMAVARIRRTVDNFQPNLF